MENIFEDITNELKESAFKGSDKYLETFQAKEEEIIRKVQSFSGIKSEFYCSDISKLNKIAKLLSVYSDLTSIFTAPGSISEYKIHLFKEADPRCSDRIVTVPNALIDTELSKGYPWFSGYLYRNDADTKKIVKTIEPLLSSGKFLLRPVRTILITPPKTNENPNHGGNLYYAASDTPLDHWLIKSENEKDSYVIDNGLKSFQTQKIFEITLPYIDGVSIENLAKILEDESDLLSKFRITLKNLGKRLTEVDNIDEFRNDEILPQIDEINRKFKTISGIHRNTIRISVGTFTLSLLAITITPNLNFQTLFNALIGSSALGFWTSERQYQTDLDKLKDNPYFLLWKISRVTN